MWKAVHSRIPVAAGELAGSERTNRARCERKWFGEWISEWHPDGFPNYTAMRWCRIWPLPAPATPASDLQSAPGAPRAARCRCAASQGLAGSCRKRHPASSPSGWAAAPPRRAPATAAWTNTAPWPRCGHRCLGRSRPLGEVLHRPRRTNDPAACTSQNASEE